MSLEDFLAKDTATVQQPALTRDTSGGPQHSPWTDLFTNVPVRIDEMRAAEKLRWAQLGLEVSHTVFTEQPNILKRHRLVSSDGMILLVEEVNTYRGLGNLPTYYELLCRQVLT